MVAKDIGDYSAHPCFHNCLFCYANPTPVKRGNFPISPGGFNP